LAAAPGAQHSKNKFRRDSLWVNNGRGGRLRAVSLRAQLLESPLVVGIQLVQGCLGAIFLRNLPPAFVKHCQFGSVAVGFGVSMISFLCWSVVLCWGLVVLFFCGCVI